MADADEDALAVPSTLQQDDDPSDETQDFRFLASLSSSVILDPNQKLPKRGEKDFEANSTKLQANTLEASRQALHDALNHTRFHNPKNHVIAYYDPTTRGAWVGKAKGILFNTIGIWRRDKPRWLKDSITQDEVGQQSSGLWLHPEEALYMLERGSLDVHWPPLEADADAEAHPTSLPMSLQGAYAAFIGLARPQTLTLEQYIVYAGLKRGGFTVIRASDSSVTPIPARDSTGPVTETSISSWTAFAAFWQRILTRGPRHPEDRINFGPLVTPGLYRSYSEIYRLLSVVPYHKSAVSTGEVDPPTSHTDIDVLIDGTSRLQITYHAYKTSTPYSKRAPPSPDFNIVVFNARDSTVPSLAQLEDLMSRLLYDPPTDTRLYQKLKHGYRNVLLAVVDQGIASYTRLSDTGFGHQKVYDIPRPRGGKRGRGGRGRGRGGGRGGRGG